MIKNSLSTLHIAVTCLAAIVAAARAQIPPQTVDQAFQAYVKTNNRSDIFASGKLSAPDLSKLNQRYKDGFVDGGLGNATTCCAFLAHYQKGYIQPGNWVTVASGTNMIAIAPKAMFANADKWPGTTDGKSTNSRTGRQMMRVFDRGKWWRVNWALGSGEYIKSYPMMGYNLKTSSLISSNLTGRKLTSNWKFQFGYPKNSSGIVDSSKMDYNVMHELYFKGTATGANGTKSVRIQVELAQSKNHSTAEIRRVSINGSTWIIGFFHNAAANQYVWQFTRPKTTYYRKIGGSYYPPFKCSTAVDIFPLLRWLKSNPDIAKEKNSGNPTFPASLEFYRVETGIEIVRGLDGSSFQSDSYSMSEK